ncbi:MAG: SGNH/GDSL hydrolase family protein [Planctomycetota bacterium]
MADLRRVPVDDEFFEGVISLERRDGWVRPWRIPFEERRLFPPDDGVPWQAQKGSGVRLRFGTDSGAIGLALLPVLAQDTEQGEVDPRRYDLTIDGELIGSQAVGHGDERVVFDPLPAGDKVVELWLNVHAPTRVRSLLLDRGATAESVPDERPKWVTYGSSITNCRGAHSPARTWPAIVARAHGLNLTSLGFGGQCHLDPMVARVIRDRPADFISLKLGINVMGAGSLSPRSFRPAIIGMVALIREKHPDVPMVLVSALGSPPRESTANEVGFTLRMMRQEVEDAYRRLVDAGDDHLYYVNGLDLFTEEDARAYTDDLLHPNGDGYEVVGANFSRVVMSRIHL